ncbi:MAG: hypothetical protein H7246_22575 [Phycisphaerae bacterium]|nr:hypothetical protein [Saprospiraceae bacterium]
MDSFFVTAPFWDHGQWIDSIIEAKVYIPNIIVIDTTGGNQDNEMLTLSDGNYVTWILSSVYSDENGQTLFMRDSFLPNTPAEGWGGLKPDGTYYQGVFNYELVAEFIDGQTRTYRGKACAYICHSDDFPTQKLPDCFFQTQHDGNGGIDQNLDTPVNCF